MKGKVKIFKEILTVSEIIGGRPAAMAPTPDTVMSGGFATGELALSTRVQVMFSIQ